MLRRVAIIISVIAVAGSGTALATQQPWQRMAGRTTQGGPVGIGVILAFGSSGQLKGVSAQIGVIATCSDGTTQGVTTTFPRLGVHLHHHGRSATFHGTITKGGSTATITGQMTRARAHGTFSFSGMLYGSSCQAGPLTWSAQAL
jgi:hypothetical protein